MKTASLFFFLATLGTFAARTEVVTLNLANPKQPFTLSFTDATATTVEARLKTSAVDFDSSGWTGLLWYGVPGGGGITLTNVAASAGVMTWDVTESRVPTNGRYSVQIFGFQANRLEEWGRGSLTVNSSSSKGSLPAEWQSPSSVLLAAINAATNALSVSFAETLASVTGALVNASEVTINNEAALRAAGDAAGTNYTDAAVGGKVSTTDPAYLAACTGSVYYAGLTTFTSNRVVYNGPNAFTGGGSQTTQVYVAQSGTAQVARVADTAVTVTGVQSNKIANALTNTPTLQQVVTAGGAATNIGDLAQSPGAIFKPGYMTYPGDTSFGLDGPYGFMWWPDKYNLVFTYSTNTALGYVNIDFTGHEININREGQNYAVRSMLTSITNSLDGKLGTNDPAFLGAVAHTNRTDNPHAVTPAQIGAISNTPAGIAAGGGIVTNSIPGPGCTYLGTSQAVTLTGATTSYRAEPAGVYTVSVAQAASRYTYALEVISTNPCTLAAGLNLQGSWTITGTNILAIAPCTGTLWRVYGRGL
jgi:hypothetical protein